MAMTVPTEAEFRVLIESIDQPGSRSGVMRRGRSGEFASATLVQLKALARRGFVTLVSSTGSVRYGRGVTGAVVTTFGHRAVAEMLAGKIADSEIRARINAVLAGV